MDDAGLERFGWDCVDAVERCASVADGHGGGDGDGDGDEFTEMPSADVAEDLACQRWNWHLCRIRRGG